MNKKIVVIAISHPEFSHLFLHGLRRDNGKWSLPGGHFIEGETPLEAANRELKEETGLTGVQLDLLSEKEYGSNGESLTVHLFSGKHNNMPLSGKEDPDDEFLSFKFLDPNEDFNAHVPKEQNILLDHLSLNKSFKKWLAAAAAGSGILMAAETKADATHVYKYLDSLKKVPNVTVQHSPLQPNVKMTNSNLKIGNFNIRVKALGGGSGSPISNHSIELYGPKNESAWSKEDRQSYADAKYLYNHLQDNINKLMKMGKPALKQEVDVFEALIKDDATEAVAQELPNSEQIKAEPPLTVKGKAVQPNQQIKSKTKASFDTHNGILHTPKGSFQIKIPSLKDQDYQKILNSSDIQDVHSGAMKNWFKLNNLIRSGQKIPDEIVAHANLFSILSANTPVPQQELMYSRLIDTAKEKGLDPRTPEFAQAFSRNGGGRLAWLESDSPTEFPKLAQDYWKGKARPAITQTRASKMTGRKPGDIVAMSTVDAFADRVSKYPQMHKYISDLVSKHQGNTQKIVSEMMADKSNPKLPKDHPMKIGVGLGSKTSRYAMSMLGGGNSVIPDTHFIRHIFGLDSNTDSLTSDYLKEVLWEPKNHHLLNQLDEFYHKRHPAVRFVTNKYFDGVENEHSNFPSFWLHWLSIAPHEKAQGIGKPYAAKNLTDHTPFFVSANEILHKYGLEDKVIKSQEKIFELPLQFRTAAAAHELNQKFGPEFSSMIFYHKMLPFFLEKGKKQLNKAPLIHDDSSNPMEIIRVQNEAGEGPYTGDADIDVPSLAEHGSENGHPSPTADKGFTKEDIKSLNDFNAPNKIFGFKNEHELMSWFTPDELEDLKHAGFKPTKIKASKVWGSGKQVFFEKYVKPLRQKKKTVKTETANFEELNKSLKEKYQSMIKDHPQSAEIADWTRSTLPNENWGTWYLRNVKNDPSIHNEQNKKDLQHLSGMAHLPEVSSVRFDKTTSFENGIKKLKEAEQKGVARTTDASNLLEPEGKQLTPIKNNMAWFDLGKGSCKKEAEAMGHCGNVPSEWDGDRLLSLRKIVNFGNHVYHQPHLTFIENNGWLGEMKGKANKKPSPKYHDNILDLLKTDRIKHVAGGGYEPTRNFELSDLNSQQKNELKKIKPKLDIWDLSPEEESELAIPKKHDHDVKQLLNFRNEIKEEIFKSKKKFFGPKPTISSDEIRKGVLNKIERREEDPNLPKEAAFLESRVPELALNLVPNITDSEIDRILRSKAFLVHKNHALQISKNPEHLDYIFSNEHSRDRQSSEKRELQLNALNHDKINGTHLSQAVNSPFWNIRNAAYRHEKISTEILDKKFDEEKDPKLKTSIAENPNASDGVVRKFLNLNGDPETETLPISFVSTKKFRPEIQNEIQNGNNKIYIRALSMNEHLVPEIQMKMSQNKDDLVCLGMAKNQNLIPEAQKNIINREYNGPHVSKWDIFKWLALNPKLTEESQQTIMEQVGSMKGPVDKWFIENPNKKVYERWKKFQENLNKGNLEKNFKQNYKLSVESFKKPELLPGGKFDPKKHDFTVKIHGLDGNQIGFMTVSHHFLHPNHLMTYQFEVDKKHRGQGFGTKLANYAEKISGKKLMETPDMTVAGKAFAQKYALTRQKT